MMKVNYQKILQRFEMELGYEETGGGIGMIVKTQESQKSIYLTFLDQSSKHVIVQSTNLTQDRRR